jgi:3-oxoacyl-[acyl-carrier protein] reductase
VAKCGDAADFDLAGRLVEEIERELGAVDVLVNVAGGGQPKGILEMTPEEFDEVQRRNLRSAWNWIRRLAPGMVTRQGQRIISISSMSAKYGGGPPFSVSRSAYAAAKAGVLGLTRGLAKELAPNVTVNAICPGLIETANTRFIAEGPHRDALLASIPKARAGRGDDVAAAVLFFASPGADWITGRSWTSTEGSTSTDGRGFGHRVAQPRPTASGDRRWGRRGRVDACGGIVRRHEVGDGQLWRAPAMGVAAQRQVDRFGHHDQGIRVVRDQQAGPALGSIAERGVHVGPAHVVVVGAGQVHVARRFMRGLLARAAADADPSTGAAPTWCGARRRRPRDRQRRWRSSARS